MPGIRFGHLFQPIHIQGCRQKHVRNRCFFVLLAPVWIHSHRRMLEKPVGPNVSLAVSSDTGLNPFIYKDVVKSTLKNPRFLVFLTPVWIHSYTMMSPKPCSKIEQNANLAVSSAPIHIRGCRQNHVQGPLLLLQVARRSWPPSPPLVGPFRPSPKVSSQRYAAAAGLLPRCSLVPFRRVQVRPVFLLVRSSRAKHTVR